MPLSKLPDNVLRTALQYSLHVDEKQSTEFKRNVVLLSICHRLRVLGLPLVYGTLFVLPGSCPTISTYAEQLKANKSLLGPGMDTNLDLVLDGKLANVVQKLSAEMYFDNEPFSNILAILGSLARVSKRWYSITALHFVFRPDLFRCVERDNDTEQNKHNIKATCSTLQRLMPSVNMLQFQEASQNVLIRDLCGKITNTFADKLYKLDSRVQLLMPEHSSLKILKRVSLDFNNSLNNHCINISPHSLVSLRLTAGSGHQIWQPFISEICSKNIVFSNLKFLEVIYSSWQRNTLEYIDVVPNFNENPCVLHFPSLKKLYINDKHCTNTFLSNVVLPAHMDSITIHTSDISIKNIKMHDLPSVRNLNIAIDAYASNAQTLAIANEILSCAKKSQKLQLRVFNDKLPITAVNTSCTSLTHLYVAAPTCVDTMIGLIQKLNNLNTLELHSLKLGKFPIDTLIPEPGENKQVKAFNTRIKMLDLDFNAHEFPSRAMIPVIRYMLLKIPTLERVISPKVSENSIFRFIAKYLGEYPHLTNIKFRLRTSYNI